MMEDKVGIKTDKANRIRVRGEMIVGDLDGLVADLGNGFFVVTKEAHDALIKLGIKLQVEEIHKGKPPSSTQGDKMIRVAELEGSDKDLLLMFLYELERRKMIWSKLELSVDEKRTERVWYGYQSSPSTVREGVEGS